MLAPPWRRRCSGRGGRGASSVSGTPWYTKLALVHPGTPEIQNRAGNVPGTLWYTWCTSLQGYVCVVMCAVSHFSPSRTHTPSFWLLQRLLRRPAQRHEQICGMRFNNNSRSRTCIVCGIRSTNVCKISIECNILRCEYELNTIRPAWKPSTILATA